MWRKFLMSRKFVLAALALLFSCVALPLGWLTGGQWVTVVGVVIGAYHASNVAQMRYERDPIPPPDETDTLED
jgi:hypothetical protein